MAFKIFHTSDWHLGKKLYKISRIPEQEFFLNWLIEEIKKEAVDALIIAGDIFDSPIPPTEALALYFSFLNRLIQETHCNAYIISGNHDSGKFLEAPKSILPNDRIFIQGQLTKNLLVTLNDQKGNQVNMTLLPYFRSHEIINLGKELGFKDDETEILEVLKKLITIEKPSEKCMANILVGHHLFGSFMAAGSEQSLSLSGLDSLPLELFKEQFNYLALGHIHKPQPLGPNSAYSGSPIPFRFSETHPKILKALTIDHDKFEIQNLPIPQARTLYCLNCNQNNYQQMINDLIEKDSNTHFKSLVEIKLKLSAPQNEIIDNIRNHFLDSPLELLAIHTILPTKIDQPTHIEIENTPDLSTLFDQYYKIKNPDANAIPEKIFKAFQQIVEEINNPERL